MTKRYHVKREANTITKKADDSSEEQKRRCRKRGADQDADSDVDRTSNQPLQLHNLQRVGLRDFAGQIVVEAPGGTSAYNREWTEDVLQARYP